MKFKQVDKVNSFRKLRKMEKAFDVVFRVEDQRFRAHRSVLSLASPYFENMLFGDMKESGKEEVVLSQFSPQTWRAIIDFIYI